MKKKTLFNAFEWCIKTKNIILIKNGDIYMIKDRWQRDRMEIEYS